jgi:O-antigen/teichoic acid export membrane protein
MIGVKKSGLLFRYGGFFSAVMIMALIVFSLVAINNPAILDIPYIPYLLAALFIAFLISGVAFISGFLRGYGKWGLIIIGITTALAVLRILILRHL